MPTCVGYLVSRGYLKVAYPLACQTFQEVLLEEFQDLQGVSTVNNFVFFIIFFLIFKFSAFLSISITEVFSPCRGSQPIITSTTVEVVVPRAVVPVIYGEDGECLKQILQVNPLHLIIYDVNFEDFICLLDDLCFTL